MTKLGYIPVDSRPLHLQQFQSLALARGYLLLSPPRSLLGTLEKPASITKIQKWLRELEPFPSCWLLSLDLIMHGGLIQARTPQTSFHQAFQNLSETMHFLKSRKCQVFAFSFLPRLAPSVTKQEELEDWKKAQELFSRTKLSIFSPFSSWKKRSPDSSFLEEIYFVRRRNFFLTETILEKFVPCPISCLLLCQEDTSPQGLHRQEIKALLQKIKKEKLEPYVTIHTGGDEAPYLLFSKISSPEKKEASFSFYPPHASNQVALYEDKPQKKVFKEKWLFLNYCRKSTSKNTILIYAPFPPRDLLFDPPFAVKFKLLPASCLIDNTYCNGGNLPFLVSFFQSPYATQVKLIAGGNTFANKCGIALSAYKILLSGIKNEKALEKFFLFRLLDDYLYQAFLRKKLFTLCQKKNWDFWNLSLYQEKAKKQLQAILNKEWKSWQKKIPPFRQISSPSISFPFGRGFEAEFEF